MEGGDLELGELLAAAEAAPPGESVDVIAHDLQKRLGAERVSFLFVDLIGQRLVRLAAADDDVADRAEPIALQGSVYDSVLCSQRQHVEPDGQGGRRVVTPVTNRGDCIGVLEMTLQSADDAVLRQVRDAAHALAYIIVTDGRFTDLYHLGRRTTETSLAAEIQHQLLPPASCCEATQFTLAAGLVPADDIGGDTYDYSLDRGTLHLSITDAMGHDTNSALLATLLVGALRRARRSGCDALKQADHAHQALLRHSRGLATGQLLCVDLETGLCELVNAGHPWPLRLRDGTVEEVELAVNLPFGVAAPIPYRVQELQLRPGDRLILVTDGMQDRGAAAADLVSVVHDTRALHPREVVRSLTAAVLDACHGNLKDDATVLILDWHGNQDRSAETRPGPQR
ncbi:PP2C family protein-serine/threonine phosphatase [Streptomyces europaeiscabiei]|uniref:PP2C family protein-serine/threonine phosphatase n=1 Tax=Streptomyces europaeiscabiei TaxID=146819 RepID=UPI00062867C3|nr:PP2C family protein-serine/threonine phosphatase [Streptomyces europaeiscabiei]MDX2524323.1 PP2C family protein-serine/threonine phosphatase [Streptomyces europaeiscabiei]MDX2757618.1 PP2C family protein-serine/threonine phosphatase [Streptomyces europaeiscabiei]MDX2767110.1 PP2C family protein-serine/threonine phosphatase [Streptomyces europaeiscabiei]MDX3670790.1 PP2C family protein-serine/threonine phosphatase [Streptomyces europaeiscabiei]MDX3710540.1 PP2C family protein-serine/threonin